MMSIPCSHNTVCDGTIESDQCVQLACTIQLYERCDSIVHVLLYKVILMQLDGGDAVGKVLVMIMMTLKVCAYEIECISGSCWSRSL